MESQTLVSHGVVLFLAAQTLTAVAGENLIQDSSFEKAKGKGWKSNRGTTQRAADNQASHSGAYSLRITGDGTKAGGVYQDLKVFDKQHPTIIKLSYWGKITDENDVGRKGLTLMTKLATGKDKWSSAPALKMNAEDVGKWVKKRACTRFLPATRSNISGSIS